MAILSKKTKKKEVEETTVVEATSQEVAPSAEVSTTKPTRKREHFFGTLLIGLLIIIVCFGLFGVGFGAFTLWQKQSLQNDAPSISGLSTAPLVEKVAIAPTETKEAEAPAPKEENGESLKAAQGLDVIVMNGGGAKGVATEAAALLKKEGFTKVNVGNTTGNFTGTVLYAKKEKLTEAEALKAKLVSKYPSLSVKEALASDKETQTATLTLIFGKE